MPTRDFTPIYTMPHVAGIYALYGDHKTREYAAYVGMAARVDKRIYDHLVRSDSSIVGPAAVRLNPDAISSASWWIDSEFSDETIRLAAELIADEVLKPNMRTRRGAGNAARRMAEEPKFKARMKKLFTGKSSGQLQFPNVSDLEEKITKLEKRIAALEKGG